MKFVLILSTLSDIGERGGVVVDSTWRERKKVNKERRGEYVVRKGEQRWKEEKSLLKPGAGVGNRGENNQVKEGIWDSEIIEWVCVAYNKIYSVRA